MNNTILSIARMVREAEAVLVGVGSGLSSAAGYNHYHHNTIFEKYFRDFEDVYGIKSSFERFYHIYSKPEQQWGFYSRYIRCMEDAPPGQPYKTLKEILQEKEYFILTTNCDIQIPKVFPKERICQFQGDFRYFQCSQPCHDKLYESHKTVSAMLDGMEGLEVPADLIPRCPECGWKMIPWVRDNTFLQGKEWKESYERYEMFVSRWNKKKLLLLELGVGDMTPSVIKLPFWDMTAHYPDTTLITVNLEKSSSPAHLSGRSLMVSVDLGYFLQELRKEMAKIESV